MKVISFLIKPHFVLCILFFIFYSTLSIVKHNHYLSGYDLGIANQIVWGYSHFKLPVLTVHAYAFMPALSDHVEFIYLVLSPFYWLFNDAKILILLQSLVVSLSGLPIYFLARRKGINKILSISILISYLMFYGIQNAIWFDVHSLAFGAGFLPWFIYFLDVKNKIASIAFFFLSILSKEDIALLTFLISLIYFLTHKDKKIYLFFIFSSVVYLLFIFFIYFPHFTQSGYRYQNTGGLLVNLDINNLYDTSEKKEVFFYSFSWFGFIPFLNPLYLLLAIGDLAHYFVFGSDLVTSAQGMFMHYRISLASLLVWSTIIVISKYKRLNTKFLAIYILFFALLFQYTLHLPLSYLTKKWFWTEPSAVKNIEKVIKFLPDDSSVVSQNNITPHISGRDNIFTLWPDKKDFKINSPCQKQTCYWFRWAGKPEFLIVDTSLEWDIRHFLTNREKYVSGLSNLEKEGIISAYKKEGSAVLYKVNKKP